MHLHIVAFFITLILTVLAVPELEHDREEYDIRDCKFFTTLSCIRECPRGYVGVYRDLCFAAEDRHECCAVRCCRSRHNNEQEAEEDEGAYSNEHYQPASRNANRNPTGRRSGSHRA